MVTLYFTAPSPYFLYNSQHGSCSSPLNRYWLYDGKFCCIVRMYGQDSIYSKGADTETFCIHCARKDTV
jgi:hypothetical protein